MTEKLEPFLKMIRTTRQALLALGGTSIALSILLMFMPADRTVSANTNLLLKVAIIGFFAVMGAYFVFVAYKSPLAHKGIETLLQRSHDVVWICPVRQLRNGFHQTTKYNLYLVDGKRTDVVAHASEERVAETTLQQICPRALFGFSREWEAQFKANPASMKR